MTPCANNIANTTKKIKKLKKKTLKKHNNKKQVAKKQKETAKTN